MSVDWQKNTETSDFWLGVFANEDAYWECFGESDDYCNVLKPGPATVELPRRGAPPDEHHQARTKFLADHDQIDFYNNGVAEAGFNPHAQSIVDLVGPYSYSAHYAEELSRRAGELGVIGINTFVFVGSGEILKPRTIRQSNYQLYYVGPITHSIEM